MEDHGDKEHLWARLTEPSPLLTDPIERRQARDLSSLLLMLSILTLMGSVLAPFLIPPGAAVDGVRVSQVGILATLLLEAGYFLSRTRNVRDASLLMVAVAEGTAWGAVLLSPLGTGPTLVLVLVVPLLLASLTLPTAYTIALGTVNLMGLAVAPRSGITTLPLDPFPVALLGIVTLLLTVTALYRNRDLVHMETQRNRLTETEDRVKTLYEATFEGIVVHKDGKVLDANRSLGPMFGYGIREVVGMDILELFKRGYREEFEASPPWGKGGRQEAQALHRDGSEFDVEFLSKPHTMDDRQVWITAFRDITEQKRSRRVLLEYMARLKRSNDELEQFAYATAHDLQEPLRDIGRYVQLLEQRYGHLLDEEGQSYVDTAVQGANRLHALLNDLLEYLHVAEEPPEIESVDLEEVIPSVLRELEDEIDRAHAAVTVGDLPVLQVDRQDITIVLRHLISNGLKFHAGTTPRVHVDGERGDGAWLVTVEDNGIGIAPEYHDRIFSLFRRLHQRNEYPGTGIGLAVAKKVVENHGGTIRVSSRRGEGSRFTLRIPDPGNRDPSTPIEDINLEELPDASGVIGPSNI